MRDAVLCSNVPGVASALRVVARTLSVVLLPVLLGATASQAVAADPEFADELPSGQVYRYVDAEGNVLFTDQRPEGAEPVTVPSGNQYEGREAARRARAASSNRGREDEGRPQAPRSRSDAASGSGRQAQPSQEQIQERIAACERSNVADCSPSTVMRRLEEERYRMTPEGRRQQQAVGNRANN